jgi:acyl-CoA synthetase (AMP-forming)/AMP-acid ligase II
MYQPWLKFIEAILACFATGVIAVPVQPLQNRRVLPRLAGILSDAGCHLLVTDKTSQEMLLQRVPDMNLLEHVDIWQDKVKPSI